MEWIGSVTDIAAKVGEDALVPLSNSFSPPTMICKFEVIMIMSEKPANRDANVPGNSNLAVQGRGFHDPTC
jgi:hypothetical protein